MNPLPPGAAGVIRRNLIERLRQDIGLKLISLFTAILLFVYVQAEQNVNPLTTVTMYAGVEIHGVPPSSDAEASMSMLNVRVTGPRILVENLRAGDIRAETDLTGQPGTQHTVILPVRYDIPGLKQDARDQIHVEGPLTIHVQIFPHISRVMTVKLSPISAPPGYFYDHAIILPPTITVSGRADLVNSVVSLTVNPAPGQGRGIDGNFSVTPLNKANTLVNTLTLSPGIVHVEDRLIAAPPARLVSVSPYITSLPIPPLRITGLTVTPPRVKVEGPLGLVDTLATVPTTLLDLSGLTKTSTYRLPLNLPAGVYAYDEQGKEVHEVFIKIEIGSLAAAPPHAPDPALAPSAAPPVTKP